MKNIKIFPHEAWERKRRIRASQDLIVHLPYISDFVPAKRIPAHLFNRNICEDIFFHYVDHYIVLIGQRYTPDSYKKFIDAIWDKMVRYAIIYEDLDGTKAQTSFHIL